LKCRTNNIDISLTGFEVAEIDQILRIEDSGDLDEFPANPGPPVSELGDLWILGKHRIHCADGQFHGFIWKFGQRNENPRLHGGGRSLERTALSLHFPAIREFYRQSTSYPYSRPQ